MSEDEYIYPESGSDDEDGTYDYGSDGDGYDYGSDANGSDASDEMNEGGDLEVELTNSYYLAEDHFSEKRFQDALEEFEKLIAAEAEHAEEVQSFSEGPWSFLAMARLVMIHLSLNRMDKVVPKYKALLDMMHLPYVTANQRERAIDDALNGLAQLGQLGSEALSQQPSSALTLIGEMYALTLKALEDSKMERLWFKTNVSQAKMMLENQEYSRIEAPILSVLYSKCTLADGTDDPDRASDLLELRAIHTTLLYKTGNFSRMKKLYPKTKASKSAVEDVRVMGTLRELGGRMYMRERQWSDAYNEFFESFQAYNESGKVDNAISCLKYLVIANIISNNSVNPFDAREIRAFTGNREIDAMRELRIAYQNDNILKFEATLNFKPHHIIGPFHLEVHPARASLHPHTRDAQATATVSARQPRFPRLRAQHCQGRHGGAAGADDPRWEGAGQD